MECDGCVFHGCERAAKPTDSINATCSTGMTGAHTSEPISASNSRRNYKINNKILRGNLGSHGSNSMVLVASLRDHVAGQAVKCMAVAEDSSFFVTASDDGTVKVWKSKGSGTMLEGGHHSVGSHSLAGRESSPVLSKSSNLGAKVSSLFMSAPAACSR